MARTVFFIVISWLLLFYGGGIYSNSYRIDYYYFITYSLFMFLFGLIIFVISYFIVTIISSIFVSIVIVLVSGISVFYKDYYQYDIDVFFAVLVHIVIFSFPISFAGLLNIYLRRNSRGIASSK